MQNMTASCALQNGDRQSSPAYILTLRRYASELGVREVAIRFAEALARGSRDIVIVLLEPLEYFQATSIAEGAAASHTLREIDRFLKQASNNRRNLKNTVVLDVRVFLTAQMRDRMTARQLAALEERSFAVFQRMLKELNPLVILSCQCATATAKNAFVRHISSTFPPPSELAYLQIGDRQVPLLKAFHPGVYKEQHIRKWVGPDQRKQKECQRILTDLLGVIFWWALHTVEGADIATLNHMAVSRQISGDLTKKRQTDNIPQN